MNKNFSVYGLASFEGDQLTGFLHYILHPVTGHIEPVCYMQDVFVAPPYRGKGTAKQLIEALSELGKKEGWARLYWMAEQNNIAAQKLYRDIGVRLNFSFHVLPL